MNFKDIENKITALEDELERLKIEVRSGKTQLVAEFEQASGTSDDATIAALARQVSYVDLLEAVRKAFGSDSPIELRGVALAGLLLMTRQSDVEPREGQ